MADMEWATPGAKVAELQHTYTSYRADITTVERLTATQIVCASGRKYRRDNGRQVGDGKRELCPVGDGQVQKALIDDVMAALDHRVDDLLRERRDGKKDPATVLDEIDKATAAARSAITKLAREG